MWWLQSLGYTDLELEPGILIHEVDVYLIPHNNHNFVIEYRRALTIIIYIIFFINNYKNQLLNIGKILTIDKPYLPAIKYSSGNEYRKLAALSDYK